MFFSAFAFLISCNSKKSVEVSNKTKDTFNTFIREIPRYKDGPSKDDTSYLFMAIREDERKLGLQNLENGYDSLEIRIWLGHSLAIKRNIVIIQRHGNNWNGRLVTFTKTGLENLHGKFKTEVKEMTPKSGWDCFIRNLLLSRLTTLPDANDIIGYTSCGEDGLPYYFEIATRDTYRFLAYCNIDDNVEKFGEARYVADISRLVEKEFVFEFTK